MRPCVASRRASSPASSPCKRSDSFSALLISARMASSDCCDVSRRPALSRKRACKASRAAERSDNSAATRITCSLVRPISSRCTRWRSRAAVDSWSQRRMVSRSWSQISLLCAARLWACTMRSRIDCIDWRADSTCCSSSVKRVRCPATAASPCSKAKTVSCQRDSSEPSFSCRSLCAPAIWSC